MARARTSGEEGGRYVGTRRRTETEASQIRFVTITMSEDETIALVIYTYVSEFRMPSVSKTWCLSMPVTKEERYGSAHVYTPGSTWLRYSPRLEQPPSGRIRFDVRQGAEVFREKLLITGVDKSRRVNNISSASKLLSLTPASENDFD